MLPLLAFALTNVEQAAPATCAAELEGARQAYGTYEVVAARRAYERVADGSCDTAERAEASTELARIIWLVDGDGPAAIARLRKVPIDTADACTAAAMLGRILIGSGQSDEVAAALAPAKLACADLEPAVALAVVAASVAVAGNLPESRRLKAARTKLMSWRDLSPAAKASLQGSRSRLALGLLAKDPVEAVAGWQNFFALNSRLTGDQTPPNLAELFRSALRPRATEADRATLCDALIRAGFTEEARRLAGPATGNGPMWHSVRAYLRMRERLETVLTMHNRAYASEVRADDAELETSIVAIVRDAVAQAGEPAADPWPALRKRWNLVGTIGRSNGVEGLHLGHVSADVKLSVKQGNRAGEVRFVALDNMIANGFSGWLGDGITGPGGWAADGQIIQVRTRYVQTALDRAAIASPGPMRDAFVARLGKLEASDRSLHGPSAEEFMPSLAARLQLSAVDALADEIGRARGVSTTFTARFASLWYSRSFESTILQHEGRHALDQSQFAGDAAVGDAELEYRAKLSELEYGASPKVALSNIYSRLLGGTTGHGIANLRLVEAMTIWLASHRDEISDYDPSVPPLLQLWRIDDRQLREIAGAIDPASRADCRRMTDNGSARAASRPSF